MRLPWLVACCCLPLACAQGAGPTLNDYLSKESCADRVALVVSPGVNAAYMAEEYKSLGTCIVKHDPIDDAVCKNVVVGDYCRGPIDLKQDGKVVAKYCVKRTDDGFRVDWRCSSGFNAPTLSAFKAQRMQEANTFRVAARLDTYFNFEYRNHESTHYSIAMRDRTGESIHGYIARSAPEATAIYELLKDGQEHAVTMELVYNQVSMEPSVVGISRMVASDWHHRGDEK